MSEVREQVDTLLHDAQQKHGGAKFADFVGDTGMGSLMREEAARMVREAYAIDPAYCERCRQEDEQDGGVYADFWTFAQAHAGGAHGR